MSVDAIVLAAGASRRLGYPKALAPIAGEPALARVLRTLREAGAAAPVVVLGAHEDAVRAGISKEAWEGARVVVNPTWERGRTGSLKAGLLALRMAPHRPLATPRDDSSPSASQPPRRFLLAPVDRPLFTASDVGALLAVRQAIVVPVHDGRRGHPILLDCGLESEILALADDAPLHAVVRADESRVAEVPVSNPGILFNLDTPEDAEAVAASRTNGRASNGRGPAALLDTERRDDPGVP